MLQQNRKIREIRESHTFRSQIKKLFSDWRRGENFIDGVKCATQRNPEVGFLVDNNDPPYRALRSEKLPGMKPVIVYYTYNDDMICLVAIVETSWDDDQESDDLKAPPRDGTELEPNRVLSMNIDADTDPAKSISS